MVEGNCTWCGASISDIDKECPTCGKAIGITLKKKDYSNVFQQQGRVLTDADWRDSPRIVKSRTSTTGVRCSSCGAINIAKTKQCVNCGASL